MKALQENWPITPLSSTLSIEIHDAPSCDDPECKAQVETIWQEACRANPRLYNGRVFCLSALTSERLVGFWCGYREVFAQMRSAELSARLRLRSLAVTALFLCSDGIVLGRRNPKALYLPGAWQSVPAGSVETRTESQSIDLEAQLRAELKEELGFDQDVVVKGPTLACEHPTTGVVDIGFFIETKHRFHNIRETWQHQANDEYDTLACLRWDHANAKRETLLPTTRALLDRYAP